MSQWLIRLQQYLRSTAPAPCVHSQWQDDAQKQGIVNGLSEDSEAKETWRAQHDNPDLYITIYTGVTQHDSSYRHLCMQLLISDENILYDFGYIDRGRVKLDFNHCIKAFVYPPDGGGRLDLPEPKTKFCAFLYWNKSCPTRNRFYDLLSQYRRVDALGHVMRNTHSATSGRFVEPRDTNTASAYRPYKFVISFENSIGKHYISEKIFTTYAGGAVPIYWGSPHIAQYYNPESFINAYDFDSLESLVDYVIKVDEDDCLYERYRTASVLTPAQKDAMDKLLVANRGLFSRLHTQARDGTLLPLAQRRSIARELFSRLKDIKHILGQGHDLQTMDSYVYLLPDSWRQRLWPLR